MICPHCGYSLDDGVAFCIYCGTRFGKYATGEMPPIEEAGSDAVANARHAAQPVDGASAVNAAGEPVPESAWQLVGDYPEGAAAAGAAGAAGAAMPNIPSVQPVPPANMADQGRLHADDAISQAMSQIPQEPQRRSRKGLGAVIAGLLVVAGIAVGAAYVVPNMAADAGSSSATASSSQSSAAASSSSAAGSSSSSSEADKPETKRGSTLSNATHEGEQQAAADQGETVDDSGAVYYDSSSYANGGNGAWSSGATGAYNDSPTYTVFSSMKATATSISPQEGSVTHGPELAIDGKADTAWNTNLSGVNESITITSGSAATVSGLRIINGYNKIANSGEDLYWANARAATILIEYEGGSFEYTLSDSKGVYQDITFNTPVTTSWVKITIKSEYLGNNYEDCCISEIQIY